MNVKDPVTDTDDRGGVRSCREPLVYLVGELSRPLKERSHQGDGRACGPKGYCVRWHTLGDPLVGREAARLLYRRGQRAHEPR